MKALIAMSGGVDSSVAALLVQKAGLDCIGATLKLFSTPEQAAGGHSCCSRADVEDARSVAYHLGMPHYVLNFSAAFADQVIRPFVETYEKGATPNPCIDCNRYIKFPQLLRRARELEIDRLVTGHYARIEGLGHRFLLKKARDPKKDQSYVLYAMTQDQLAHTLFPLGERTKEEVRALAREAGLINARKQESQDICFVPDGDYGRFIEDYRGKGAVPGPILDEEGAFLGRHQGLIRYTIGQRRGLGLSFPEPRYVLAKSAADNTLILGREGALYARRLSAGSLNLIAWDEPEKPRRLTAKTRYLQAEQRAWARLLAPDRLQVDFDEPQRAITPGQAVVLYDGEVVLGGGTILVAEAG
ncbi:MAG: tRNA 2-thiouridine(34) synthase MnmA [Spirochaetaceae bacterium]|jgi:tRNA-specific 2-thiouridylase|nr:tRNA 2-thiouridine(34) synthase MnmA [Spirochaetaceae bacterium]